jgi:oxaloacetate decarboxylase beta subunit
VRDEIFSGPNMAVVGISMVFIALAMLVAVVSTIAHYLSTRSQGAARGRSSATIILGICVGAGASAQRFPRPESLKIFALGLVAFSVAAATGVLFGRLMNRISRDPIDPIIGAAGVSSVPMAARVALVAAQKEDPSNFLIMHAMGPNVAGVIGSAVAAGVLLSILG